MKELPILLNTETCPLLSPAELPIAFLTFLAFYMELLKLEVDPSDLGVSDRC